MDGPIFREVATGAPWRYKAVSALKLAQRWEDGEDVSDFIRWVHAINANTVRTFLQWKFLDWPAIKSYRMRRENIRPFVDWCAAQGLYVELTVLCDSQDFDNEGIPGFNESLDTQVERVRDVLHAVSDAPNVFVEIKNEPPFNGGRVHDIITRLGLQDARNRPVLMASGEYPVFGFGSPHEEPLNTNDSNSIWVLDYIGDHPERKPEWPDEAGKTGYYVRQQCLKYGLTNVAHVYDEPIRFGEPGQSVESGEETSTLQAEDAGGGIAIRSAGGTFHSNNGVQTVAPGPTQERCSRVYFAAMDRFPADAPTGRYSHDGLADHPLEPTQHAGEVASSLMPDGTGYVVASRVRPGYEAVPKPGHRIVSVLNARQTQLETQ